MLLILSCTCTLTFYHRSCVSTHNSIAVTPYSAIFPEWDLHYIWKMRWRWNWISGNIISTVIRSDRRSEAGKLLMFRSATLKVIIWVRRVTTGSPAMAPEAGTSTTWSCELLSMATDVGSSMTCSCELLSASSSYWTSESTSTLLLPSTALKLGTLSCASHEPSRRVASTDCNQLHAPCTMCKPWRSVLTWTDAIDPGKAIVILWSCPRERGTFLGSTVKPGLWRSERINFLLTFVRSPTWTYNYRYRNTLVVVLQKMWKNMNNAGNRSNGLVGPVHNPLSQRGICKVLFKWPT